MKKIILVISVSILLANFVFDTYATANVPKYMVIIDSQADSVTIMKVDSGTVITKPAIPTKEGFVFYGWDVDINNPIKKDSVKITAKWLSEEKYQAQQDSVLLKKIHYKAEELVTPVEDKLNLLLYVVIVLAVLLIVLFICVIILLNNKRHFRNNVLNLLVTESGTRMYDFITRVAKKIKSDTQLSSIKINEKELEVVVVDIVKQIQSQNRYILPQTTTNEPQVYYADSIKSDGTFNKVTELPNDDTVFELKLERPNYAKFTVYKGAYNKIARSLDLLNGCDIQKNGNTRLKITFGKAQEQDGKWLVTTKANVKIS